MNEHCGENSCPSGQRRGNVARGQERLVSLPLSQFPGDETPSEKEAGQVEAVAAKEKGKAA